MRENIRWQWSGVIGDAGVTTPMVSPGCRGSGFITAYEYEQIRIDFVLLAFATGTLTNTQSPIPLETSAGMSDCVITRVLPRIRPRF